MQAKKILFILILLSAVLRLTAQDESYFVVTGRLTSDDGKVDESTISVSKNGGADEIISPPKTGRFRFEFDYNNEYRLTFARDGYFKKIVVISTLVPQDILEANNKFPPFQFVVNLFKEIPGIDKSFTSKPVAKVFYNAKIDNFDSDIYFSDIQLEEQIEEAILQNAELDAERKGINKANEQELAEREKEYDKTIAEADASYQKKEFKNALDKFKAANALFPDRPYPIDRIAELQDIVAAMLLAEEKKIESENKYQNAITDGNMLFENSRFDEAATAYQQALDAKANDSYAMGRLAESKQKYEQAQIDIQYNDLITQADSLFQLRNFDQARNLYNQAIALKPNDSEYASDQLALISEEVAKLQEQALAEQNYSEAMTKGNQAFQQGEYDNALNSFNQALAIKPDDRSAQERILETEKFILQLENDQKYASAIEQADRLFDQNNLAEARNLYSQALEIHPNEQHPQSRIAEIDKQVQLNEQLENLLTQANSSFDNKEYTQAQSLYQQVLQLNPNDEQSQNRIAEIGKILEQQSIDQQYDQAIKLANQAFNQQQYNQAKSAYTNALTFKPDEAYPKTQIQLIDRELEKLAAQAETENRYNEAMLSANNAFSQKDYQNALSGYQAALSVKPDDANATSRLNETLLFIQQFENQNNYDQNIAAADQAFNNGELENAKGLYQKATQILPTESYPKNQIALIDQQLNKLEQLNQTMTQAASAFDAKNYALSKSLYQEALLIQPDNNTARSRIEEIDGILAQQQLDDQYSSLISQADQAFGTKSYEPAKTVYQQASDLKPAEAYPKNQIVLIDQEIARLRELAEANEKAYQDAMTSGNTQLGNEAFDEARQAFTQAKSIKPAETLPDEMIARVDSLQRAKEQALAEARAREEAQQRERDQQYADAIREGDRLFGEENLEMAKFQYETASTIKPDETYPKQQLAAIEGKLAQLEKLNQAYSTAIEQANQLADEKDYQPAKDKYEEALQYKPNEDYPKRQILRLNEILAQIEATERLNTAYATSIQKADSLFNLKSYQPAKAEYFTASNLKQEEQYPKTKISEIDAILADQMKQQQELALTEKAYNEAIQRADQAFNAKSYPTARLNYNEAISIKPEESYPKTQLAEIDRLIALEKEQAYQAAITRADGLFKQNLLAEAKPAYQEALTINTNDVYAQTQINLINDRLEQLAKDQEEQQKLENDYKSKLALAESAFNNKFYQNSKDYYQQALNLKPQEVYPAEQIAKIDNIMQELLRQEEIDKQYNQLMIQAQGAYMQNQLQNALDLYRNALSVKPDEALPKQRITDIEGMIARQKELADLAAQEEAQRLAVEKATRERYNSAIASAEAELKNEFFAKAKDYFIDALNILPDEQYPKDKIAEIDRLIEERSIADMELKQQAYQDSIAKARMEAYDAKIADAEQHESKQQFEDAISAYREAIIIMPTKAVELNDKISQLQNQIRMLAQQNANYQQAITLADQYFGLQDWENALNSYQEALNYKPDENYPKERIRYLRTSIKEREANYAAAISQADSFFNTEDWINAKDKYSEALKIKKDESYPSAQLILVNRKIREAQEELLAGQEKEKSYQDAITKGDAAMASDQLTAAKTQYEFALSIKPGETYPTGKIAEIDALIANREQQALLAQQQRDIDDQYRQAISLADNSFRQENYNAAKTQYEQALSIKPEEEYPRKQIEQINQLLASMQEPITIVDAGQKTAETIISAPTGNYAATKTIPTTSYTPVIRTNNDYGEIIKVADDNYLRQDYTIAQFYYYKAAGIQPENPYPKQRIAEISKLIDQSLRADQIKAYNDAIQRADQEFAKSSYSIAKFYYYKALEVKSWEQYPKDQIEEIRRLTHSVLSQREEEEYNSLIANGDEAYYNRDLAVARSYYQKSLTIKNDEQYPSIKLAEIEKSIAQELKDQSTKEYQKMLSDADNAFVSKNYSIARFYYNKALTIKPNEKYPKDQIQRIKEELLKNR